MNGRDSAVGGGLDAERTAAGVGDDPVTRRADPQDPAVLDPRDETAAGPRGQLPSAFRSSFLVMPERPLVFRCFASL
jgi:hypothetical protein